MKLRGYDLLKTIRQAGAKPKFVEIYLYPVKRLPVTHEFIDTRFSTLDENSDLSDYELTAFLGLDVFLIGQHKDDRLRNACRHLKTFANAIYVTSSDHKGVDIWENGVWK